MKKFFLIIITFTLILLIFLKFNVVLDSTLYAVNIWLNKVFPYLFIMFIVNDFLISLNISNYFKSPSIYIFFMSILSGSPSSAYITGELYNQKIISQDDANTTLIFTYFSNPLFLYSITKSLFNSNHLVFKVLFIHYISNLILYLIYKKRLSAIKIISSSPKFNIASSIKNSMNNSLTILGTIVFYLVITNVLLSSIQLPTILISLIKGFMEITQGLSYIAVNPIKYKDILTIAFISFGGLSIHTQIKYLLDNYSLKYSYFLKGRIFQTIIAIIIHFILP